MRALFTKEKRIKRLLSREEFLYGLLRSDFLYYLPIDSQSIVLDVGCGYGTHTFNMARVVAKVYGCDESDENISFCKKRALDEGVSNTEFIQSGIKNLPFPSNMFDAIAVYKTSGWSKSEWRENLSALHAFLKPEGVLYFGINSFLPLSFLKKKCARITRDAGFRKDLDIYIASPNYHLPRFLIPHEDTYALKFILTSMTAYRGIAGALVRLLVRLPGGVSLTRNFFHSYAIFVKK